jgi:hypothetical protein
MVPRSNLVLSCILNFPIEKPIMIKEGAVRSDSLFRIKSIRERLGRMDKEGNSQRSLLPRSYQLLRCL